MGHWEHSSWEDAAKAMILSQETCLFLNQTNCPRGLGERRMFDFLTLTLLPTKGSGVFLLRGNSYVQEVMIK